MRPTTPSPPTLPALDLGRRPDTVRSGLANDASFTANVGALIVSLNGGSGVHRCRPATIAFTAIDANNTGRKMHGDS